MGAPPSAVGSVLSHGEKRRSTRLVSEQSERHNSQLRLPASGSLSIALTRLLQDSLQSTNFCTLQSGGGVFYTRKRSRRGVDHAQRVCCVVAPSSASVEAHVAFRECTRRVGPFEGLIAVLLLFSHVRGHSQPRTGGASMRKWAPEAARPGPAWLVTPLHGNLRGNHHTTCCGA